MITHLEELVFGLNSYEKAKIEDRYLEIYSQLTALSSYEVSTLEEFEILEKCRFKIKEQLRVKSSNLNTIIKKKNKLNLDIMTSIIEALDLKRLQVLQKIFSKSEFSKRTPNSSLGEFSDDILHQSNQHNESGNSFKDSIDISQNIQHHYTNANIELLAFNSKYQVSIATTEKIGLEIKNINSSSSDTSDKKININFKLIKKILQHLFDTNFYLATLAFIPSVQTNDLCKLYGISTLNSQISPLLHSRENNSSQSLKNVDEIHSLIVQTIQKKNSQNSDFEIHNRGNNQNKEEVSTKTIKDVDFTHLKNRDSYMELKQEFAPKSSLKDQEDSLEELIGSQSQTHTHHNFTKEYSKDENILPVEKDDDVIILQREDPIIKTPKETELEEITPYKEDKNNLQIINEVSQNLERKTSHLEINSNLQIYSDEEVQVTLSAKPIQEGQLKVSFNIPTHFEYATTNQVAHMILCSRIFLDSIFRACNSQGTMLVTSLKSSSTHLIPRFMNDSIFSFGTTPAKEEVLNQIQETIQNTMLKELESEKNNSLQDEQKPQKMQIEENQKNIRPTNETTNSTNPNGQESEKNNSSYSSLGIDTIDSSKERKARYLLSSLRRLA